MIEVVPLTLAHLDYLPLPKGLDRRAYFSDGSAAFCVLEAGSPVMAGGIVNQHWGRGEAWILPTPFFRSHFKTSFRLMKNYVPLLAEGFGFRRVQATCPKGLSSNLFSHLGFSYEGTMQKFGPHGEDCDMWSRTFEVTP